MQRVFRQILLGMAGCAVASSPAMGGSLSPCATARLIASWKHDGLWLTSAVFAPPTSVDGHDARYVGEVHAAGRAYRIYFEQVTEPGSEAHDAAHNLVVTTGGGRFLGLYNISEISDISEPMTTKGSDVLFHPRKDGNGKPYRDRIHFGSMGPPGTVHLLFGYDVTFQTPAEWARDPPQTRQRSEPSDPVVTYCHRRR